MYKIELPQLLIYNKNITKERKIKMKKLLIITDLTENLINELDKHHLDTGNSFWGYDWKQYIPNGYVVFKQQSDLSWELHIFTDKPDYYDYDYDNKAMYLPNDLFLTTIKHPSYHSSQKVSTVNQDRAYLQYIAYLAVTNRIQELNSKTFDIEKDSKYSFYYSVDNDIIFYGYYKSTIQSPTPLLMSSKEVAEQIKRELPNELYILFANRYKF